MNAPLSYEKRDREPESRENRVRQDVRKMKLEITPEKIVQTTIAPWKWDSKIVEAFAEHDFALRGSLKCLVQRSAHNFSGVISHQMFWRRTFDAWILND